MIYLNPLPRLSFSIDPFFLVYHKFLPYHIDQLSLLSPNNLYSQAHSAPTVTTIISYTETSVLPARIFFLNWARFSPVATKISQKPAASPARYIPEHHQVFVLKLSRRRVCLKAIVLSVKLRAKTLFKKV